MLALRLSKMENEFCLYEDMGPKYGERKQVRQVMRDQQSRLKNKLRVGMSYKRIEAII